MRKQNLAVLLFIFYHSLKHTLIKIDKHKNPERQAHNYIKILYSFETQKELEGEWKRSWWRLLWGWLTIPTPILGLRTSEALNNSPESLGNWGLRRLVILFPSWNSDKGNLPGLPHIIWFGINRGSMAVWHVILSGNSSH